jgi:hypothetical protein
VGLIKINCKDICKCHSVSPPKKQLLYTNKQKRKKFCHFQEHKWTRKHYSRWNNPGPEKKILYDLICRMEGSKS